jgi:hypothetical protein
MLKSEGTSVVDTGIHLIAANFLSVLSSRPPAVDLCPVFTP